MKTGFYLKLACDGIRKNKRMYIPYILTCIGMVMMYYIVVFLADSQAVRNLRGAATIAEIIDFGGWVIAIFSAIFLFYTNTFLMRRRKKEFGLYHVLGMGKRPIGRILFWESFIIAFLSIGLGLFFGITFSKLAELLMVNLMQGDIDYTIAVSPDAIFLAGKVFGTIFVLLFLNAYRQIKFSNAVSLIHSENVGEKPPKGNWLLGLLGIIILAVAYYIAVSIKNPIAALLYFFLAAIMVIVGTYLLLIAGSVTLCRILQKKKRYYYKANHFISVSSMTYRMKRNGAGLASICILITMVLVMISTTASLYFGHEDMLYNRNPREINLRLGSPYSSTFADEKIDSLYHRILTLLEQNGVEPVNSYAYRSTYVAGLLQDNTVETDVTKVNSYTFGFGFDYSDVIQFIFVPLSDYNALMGTNETLEADEALLFTPDRTYTEDTIAFHQGNTFRIKKQLDTFFDTGEHMISAVLTTMTLIVPDLSESLSGLDTLADYNGESMLTYQWEFHFDTGQSPEKQIALYSAIREYFHEADLYRTYQISSISFGCREEDRVGSFGMFGGFFYLGILLSLVFIAAVVLIIYYKQISEGYEDQMRFEIMQKVGLTKPEIRRSIHSQLLTVFYLPLLLAAVHLCFAFPIIRKLLLAFSLDNVMLFAFTTIIGVVVFAFFYALVYRVTSNAYYHIVSDAKADSE